jgi:TIR domain-containing protein
VIDDGLQSADSLIVVVSQHSAISKWVTKELAAFQEKRPEARVIPLLLDDTNPDDVIDRLTDYQALRFTDDMLSGFEKLTELYGKRFLPRIERRGKESRRNVVDRRSASERRKSEMIQRMRIGFWKAFHAKLRIGKFDKLQMGVAELFKTIEALVEEAERYGYTLPEGRQASARTVLEEATHHVWQEYRPKHQLGAVYVVEAIAEHIYATYAVSQPQQRQIQTRRDDSDRRDN